MPLKFTAGRSRPCAHLRRWVVRALLGLVVIVLTAVLTVAAETGACALVMSGGLRSCVSTAPVPDSSGTGAVESGGDAAR